MAGAEFLRADLHVHTVPDDPALPSRPVVDFVAQAVSRAVSVLGVADHNAIDRMRSLLTAAAGSGVVVLPGIEVTTHQGHVVALFETLQLLEDFAAPGNLNLRPDPRDGSLRSNRSMLDLVDDISKRNGLAIAAHVDADDGIAARLTGTELAELLAHPGLAALEFRTREALETWFSPTDAVDSRKEAWRTRCARSELRERGLARVMSSDAHTPEEVGADFGERTLTRLRLDDANYVAVRNAILLNPKARCKAEVALPRNYPRILSVEYEGGFLEGVRLEPSANLTCLIGGRGSGKSTALIAIRAAAAAELGTTDDPDDPRRMPDRTIMRFVDRFGSDRTAVRERGADPYDAATGAPIELKLADLAQDESGELARGYETNPQPLLDYLDGFCDLSSIALAEHGIEERLEANAEEVKRTWVRKAELEGAQKERRRLAADLEAAKLSRLDEVAEWSDVLSSQSALIVALESALAAAGVLPAPASQIDLDDLAKTYGADLAKRPAAGTVEGERGVRAQVGVYERDIAAARTSYATTVQAAHQRVEQALEGWQEQLRELETRRAAKEEELRAKGLHVQAGEVKRLTDHLATASTSLSQLTLRVREHGSALRARVKLLDELEAIRDRRFEARRATLRRITAAANAASDGPQIVNAGPNLSRNRRPKPEQVSASARRSTPPPACRGADTTRP
jgi:hypothetical protein